MFTYFVLRAKTRRIRFFKKFLMPELKQNRAVKHQNVTFKWIVPMFTFASVYHWQQLVLICAKFKSVFRRVFGLKLNSEKMDIDDICEESVPANLHRFALFSCRVYTSRAQYTDLMLTKGPILYEMKSKHILTSCDLSNTVLKGKVCGQIDCAHSNQTR